MVMYLALPTALLPLLAVFRDCSLYILMLFIKVWSGWQNQWYNFLHVNVDMITTCVKLLVFAVNGEQIYYCSRVTGLDALHPNISTFCSATSSPS
jgi:hypothetical protein